MRQDTKNAPEAAHTVVVAYQQAYRAFEGSPQYSGEDPKLRGNKELMLKAMADAEKAALDAVPEDQHAELKRIVLQAFSQGGSDNPTVRAVADSGTLPPEWWADARQFGEMPQGNEPRLGRPR